MSKKQRASLTLRKPGQGGATASSLDIESFIDGDANDEATPATVTPIKTAPAASPAPAVGVPSFRRANKSIAKRKTKADRRRTTVYMDLTTAGRLAEFCATTDREMSDVVNEALVQFLDSGQQAT